jgi:hypothetical protein
VNEPARGYAGGPRGPAAAAPDLPASDSPTCRRIRSTTAGSSIAAITFIGPPHRAHRSISIRNTRFSRCAHVIA